MISFEEKKMYKIVIIFFALFLGPVGRAQTGNIKLKLNAKQEFNLTKNEEHTFEISLKEHVQYTISLDQNGIDIILILKDQNLKVIQEADSPTGRFGLEKIAFSPPHTAKYVIVVKALEENGNADQGSYTIVFSKVSKKVKRFTKSQLEHDFDLLKNAYIETKVGLWYNNYFEFDSICNVQKSKIDEKMTAWDFYKLTAPITAYTKEGHSSIRISEETSNYLKKFGTYFPFFIKIINKQIYVLNNYKNLDSKGKIISKINGIPAEKILNDFTQIEPSDGYNFTSKYKWIESSFSRYLLRFYGISDIYMVEFTDPKNGEKSIQNVAAVNAEQYQILQTAHKNEFPELYFKKPMDFKTEEKDNYCLLTINDFNSNLYKDKKEGFRRKLDSIFSEVDKKQIGNLIIDLRKNEGGSQGMEDILLSYFTLNNYKKYSYVEIPSFEYSFLDLTDYKNQKELLKKELAEEFYLSHDGRYLNKESFYDGLPPNPIHFSGKIYILISGLTFSGGSEFAALAKNHTNAVFIGEETGGGYYGNTSGIFLKFTLPNSRLTGRIPLCKFVLNNQYNSISYGHGLAPDYEAPSSMEDILNHYDSELNYAVRLIKK